MRLLRTHRQKSSAIKGAHLISMRESTVDPYTYSAGEVATILGVDRRTVRWWTDVGALIPAGGVAHRGRGVHRKYSFYEIFIAGVLNLLTKSGIPAGDLADIASTIRRGLGTVHSPRSWWGGEYPFLEAYKEGIGGGQAMLLIGVSVDGANREYSCAAVAEPWRTTLGEPIDQGNIPICDRNIEAAIAGKPLAEHDYSFAISLAPLLKRITSRLETKATS